jgi:hypothetical protein
LDDHQNLGDRVVVQAEISQGVVDQEKLPRDVEVRVCATGQDD